MYARHPADAFRDLNMRARGDGIGVIVRAALDVDDVREHDIIGIENAGTAMSAEMPPTVFRGRINLGRPGDDFDCIFLVHRPTDHRSAGMTPAILAMAQCMRDRVALRLVPNRTAMTAASICHFCRPRFALPGMVARTNERDKASATPEQGLIC